jgi:RNA-directed DNA polymerase
LREGDTGSQQPLKRKAGKTLSLPTVSTKLRRIAEQAANNPTMKFATLAHLIDVELLWEAYWRTRQDAAAGIDGMTAETYEVNLEANLANLHERLRNGQYYAPPVKRVYIAKEDGSQRPIGIPVFEDKIVQRAVTMILGAIYEQDFKDCSYGFRPKRSPHQALDALRKQCMEGRIGWIVDADVSAFFDSLDRGLLREIIEQRVNDGGIIRLIGKWLNAGVLEGEQMSYPEKGTPQGGVVSPMLANIFLHHVLDEWFESEVKPRMKGNCFLIRFADDFVIGCEREEDARRIMEVLPKRFARFKLTIHPQKTRLVKFQPPRKGESDDGTFDFLGFTHYWARSRRGYWIIKRQTAKKRLRRAMRAAWEWCREHRHEPVREQYRKLSQKLRGHYQYYGVRHNYRKLETLYWYVERAWRYWLSRRGGDREITWEKFDNLREVFPLPLPRIVHPI